MTVDALRRLKLSHRSRCNEPLDASRWRKVCSIATTDTNDPGKAQPTKLSVKWRDCGSNSHEDGSEQPQQAQQISQWDMWQNMRNMQNHVWQQSQQLAACRTLPDCCGCGQDRPDLSRYSCSRCFHLTCSSCDSPIEHFNEFDGTVWHQHICMHCRQDPERAAPVTAEDMDLTVAGAEQMRCRDRQRGRAGLLSSNHPLGLPALRTKRVSPRAGA